MALLTAYFDKSGDIGEPLVVVAGIIATDFKWECLGGEWKKVMADFEIEDFHMSNFFRNGTGFPPKVWPLARKDKLAKVLTSLIYDYTQQPIAHGVTARALRDANLGTSKG